MKTLYTLTSFAVMLLAAVSVSAGIRPSFDLVGSSWHATDIVVVTEGKQIDGVFTVLETWKGDLKPGATISISEMGEFKDKDVRQATKGSLIENGGPAAAEYVTCERMVLFLIDAQKTPEGADKDETRGGGVKSMSRWHGANTLGNEVKYSSVWIEKDKLYWFMQLMNPGPSLLYGHRGTEAELKSQVADVVSTQNSLNAALAISDPATRAAGLEPFAQDSIALAREKAFAGLAECCEAALPVLRRLLDSELTSEYRDNVIEAFAKAGGTSAGPELTAWLEKELEFWKKTGPTLRAGWWNGNGFDSLDAVESIRDRHVALLHAINALGKIRYVKAEKTVNELSDLWRSLPPLYGDEITEACDVVLRQFGSKREAGKHPLPKYEVTFKGNRAFSSAMLREKMTEYVKAYDSLEELEGVEGWDVFGYAQRRLMDFISSQGYLDVGFDIEEKTTERGPLISITIDEGVQYRLGRITIEGAKQFSADQLRAKLAVREGDIADGEAIDKWLARDVEKAYRDIGYREFNLRHDVDSSKKTVADLKITINEGPQYKVGLIKFDGKTTLKTDQLNAAISLHEGDTFSQKQLDESIDELNKLGLDVSKDRDVSLCLDKTQTLVNIVIFLDKDRRARESFNRF
jgi:surface antigen-like variable number repeat protein